ncbi:MAG: hypothetical protein PVI13_12635 [Desulfobacterales bacterium]
MGVIRILFLADTHLGYDFPFRPRIERRRRGPDFFANYERALQPAMERMSSIFLRSRRLFPPYCQATFIDFKC